MRNFRIFIIDFILVQWMLLEISVASRSPGEVNPQRVELKIGGSANITCRMNLQRFSGKDSSSLYFVEQESGNKVADNDVVVINSTAVVYMMQNATAQNKEYVCKSGLNAIGVTKVYAGTIPTDVEDFSCRGYDFTYMVCNFSLPQNMILTQYNLSYTAQSPNYLQMCDLEIQEGYGLCNLTLEKSNYRPNYEFYNFTLTGHNSLGTNRQSFWVNHYESVIPPRPEIQFEQLTERSAVLSWNLVKYSYYNSRGLQYEIRIRPEHFEWLNHSNYEIRNNRSEYKLKLRGLPYAYYWYTLSVRMKMRSSRDDETRWSQRFLGKFQTKSTLPDAPPTPDIGSYYVDSSETRLRLYWKQLPHYLQNGPNFGYIIKMVQRDGQEIKIHPNQIDLISATFDWDKHHDYEFTLKSRNDVGESVEDRKITVHAMRTNHEAKAPKWIRNVYHASNHTYTLSWVAPVNAEKLVDYTVFWCESKRATLNECRSSIQYEHIDKSITKFTTAPQAEEHALNFAVSANYLDYNTGMRWTMCTADVTSDLVKLEPEITSVSARSIKLQWSPDRVCPSLLEGYNLTYCRVANEVNARAAAESAECMDEKGTTTVIIEKTTKKYLVTALEPFSSYKIEIFMFSKLKSGKRSDPIVVKTTEEAPSPPRNLKYCNVTSNSASISWMPPTQMNGNLRHYVVVQNNEQHIINCSMTAESICENATNTEIVYKLENLSSFTNYKVYIIAHTIKGSLPSNDINFKTLIGIPSNPRHMVPIEGNQTVMMWSPPIVPSGRIEFYEVAVIVWHKDQIQRQRISGVVDATSCVIKVPTCPDADHKHTLQVRAVNVASRLSEIDHHVFASNLTEEETEEENSSDALLYEGNDDIKCVGITLSEEKQTDIIRSYRNAQRFKLYKSVWEKGPTYACAATTKVSRITLIALLVVVVSLGVMAAFYFARNKYNKMANIDCALPPGLDALTASPRKSGSADTAAVLEKDDEDLRRSKESLFNNEKHHLLSSVCNDSGYLCDSGSGGGPVNSSGLGSVGKSSGYVSSDRSENYSRRDHVKRSAEPIEENASYMVMKVLKTKGDDSIVKPKDDAAADNIDNSKTAFTADSFLILKPAAALPIFPSSNGYIKPNKLFQWQSPSSEQDKNVAALMPTSSEYIQPQMVLKSTERTAIDGYTTLDALENSTLGSPNQCRTPQSLVHSPPPLTPPISGYVTQKELSAFGQHKLS